MAAEEPKIEISLKEIYDEFREVSIHLRDLVSKVDSAINNFNETTESLKKTDHDHEERLRSVERWMNAVPPTAIVAVITVILEAYRMLGKN